MRRAAVNQGDVNETCNQLMAENRRVTVSAVIAVTGGSYSTVGKMVEQWRKEKAAPPPLPDPVLEAVQRAAADIWEQSTALSQQSIAAANEVTAEVQGQLDDAMAQIQALETELSEAKEQTSTVQAIEREQSRTITELQTKLEDRDSEIQRQRGEYQKLQAEALGLAKAGSEPKAAAKPKPAAKKPASKKPSEEKLAEIRARLANGETKTAIAEELGVSRPSLVGYLKDEPTEK